MTTVRFSGQPVAGEGLVTRKLYPAAVWAHNLPGRVRGATDRFVKTRENGSFFQKAMATFVKGFGRFGEKITDLFNYCEFPEGSLGRLKFTASELPIGAMILLLYPFTIGPRMVRAYQRGKKDNDTREVWDCLRRDGAAITAFLFLLKPLSKAISKLFQRLGRIKLIDPEKNVVLTYAQLASNYKLDRTEVLLQMLQEGNGHGLRKAAKTLNDRGLSKLGHPDLQTHVANLKRLVPELVHAHENELPGVSGLAQKVIDEIRQAEKLANDAAHATGKGASEKIAKAAQKLQGEFEGFAAKYAKKLRLPSDIAAFIISIGAIGWFPVWFNGMWNKKKFEETQAKQRATEQGQFNPQLAYQSLSQSSRLARQFQLGQQNPFVQPNA